MSISSNITIYTTTSSSTSRKAIDFFESYNVAVTEIRLGTEKSPELSVAEVIQLAKLAGGFNEILGERSRLFKDELKPLMMLDTTTTSDVINFIIKNPRVLKYPIVTDGKKIKVGFNEDGVRTFLPRPLKRKMFKETLHLARTICPEFPLLGAM